MSAVRFVRTAVASVAVLSGLAAASVGASAQSPAQSPGGELVLYVAPVRAEVIDPFRPPAFIGAPGNRGLEYGTTSGDPVGAAADGRVSFAGQVAGRWVVTIAHADGVRTTYSGLTEVLVVADQHVAQFDAIGDADGGFHFGALRREHYLDPQVLIDASVPQARPRLVVAADG